jgi:hypothetical protein
MQVIDFKGIFLDKEIAMNSAYRLDRKALMSKLLPSPEIIFNSIERARRRRLLAAV